MAIEPILLKTTTDLIDRLANPCLLVDRRQRVVAVNAAFGSLFGLAPGELIGLPIFSAANGLLDRPELRALADGDGHAWREVQDLELDLDAPAVGRRVVTMTSVRIQAEWFDVGVTLLAFQDITARVLLAEERASLVAAIDHAANLIAVTDADGALTYANPAFAQLVGMPAAALVGQDVTQLLAERLTPLRATGLGRMFSASGWSGQVALAGRHGVAHIVDIVSAPVQGPRGAVRGQVIVGLDITRERRVEEELQREVADRAAVAHTLTRLRGAGTLAETAEQLCAEIRSCPAFDAAGVVMLWGRGGVVPLAVAPGTPHLQARRPLPAAIGHYLRRRAASGVWIEAAQGRRATAYGRLWAEMGLSAVASLPLTGADGPVGVLMIGTAKGGSAALARRLAPLLEFGAVATALLTDRLAEQQADALRQQEMWQVIQARAFDPVFQPVVELSSSRTIGYEALTRFHDGTDPATRFADARQVGLGPVLEDATLRAALKAAELLPDHAWLAVNVSADLVLAGSRLRRLLSNRRRQLVLEITEHEPVADGVALRSAVSRLGDQVRTLRLAVDDAGAGFNGLRFILDLAPDLVKLDRSLICGLEDDPARQSLVVAMRHFAGEVGCELIAEGVETEATLVALQRLGVSYGQGYILGAPQPVEAWQSVAPAGRGRASAPGEPA